MESILKVRDEEGTVHGISALQGKSAYAYAVEGGYTITLHYLPHELVGLYFQEVTA